jgi:hypothetical protein
MTYYPDKWLIVKTPQCYKVFGVWCGGYTSGDSWKLNSGISSFEEFDDYILFHGYSGSTYKCMKTGYGSSAYGYSILQSFGDTLHVIPDSENEMSALLDQIKFELNQVI